MGRLAVSSISGDAACERLVADKAAYAMAAAVVRAGQSKIIAEQVSSEVPGGTSISRPLPLIVRWISTGVTGTRRSWPSHAVSVPGAPEGGQE